MRVGMSKQDSETLANVYYPLEFEKLFFKLLAHTVCVYASSIIYNVKATEILRRGRYTKKTRTVQL